MHHPIHTNSHTLGCITLISPALRICFHLTFTAAWHYMSMGQRAVKHLVQGKR